MRAGVLNRSVVLGSVAAPALSGTSNKMARMAIKPQIGFIPKTGADIIRFRTVRTLRPYRSFRAVR